MNIKIYYNLPKKYVYSYYSENKNQIKKTFYVRNFNEFYEKIKEFEKIHNQRVKSKEFKIVSLNEKYNSLKFEKLSNNLKILYKKYSDINISLGERDIGIYVNEKKEWDKYSKKWHRKYGPYITKSLYICVDKKGFDNIRFDEIVIDGIPTLYIYSRKIFNGIKILYADIACYIDRKPSVARNFIAIKDGKSYHDDDARSAVKGLLKKINKEYEINMNNIFEYEKEIKEKNKLTEKKVMNKELSVKEFKEITGFCEAGILNFISQYNIKLNKNGKKKIKEIMMYKDLFPSDNFIRYVEKEKIIAAMN